MIRTVSVCGPDRIQSQLKRYHKRKVSHLNNNSFLQSLRGPGGMHIGEIRKRFMSNRNEKKHHRHVKPSVYKGCLEEKKGTKKKEHQAKQGLNETCTYMPCM
ncbi:hypothetical protein TWF569_010783 [Orbilia oligospora]|uniref:Uncharacterized protein n=1 Tax=Orbilia oligospora TaxID=2813651 RepID=A0A7C8NGY1_ORBOL|nr:hypothetical protein TWF706_009615 [Orbilia oligospora]KAF3106516.1 hypothetical protein TWF102_001460 [Orbilia oligospora]KAF3106574.1 hypothetical protein TWF103_006073 [Orbilia oligospora]KAF3123170.1 hypothetical protein TWF594_002504 [Orbilia oligospora]KAF3132800.1 hypothetical protein TWF569_010783 [Orbilia oligospora]